MVYQNRETCAVISKLQLSYTKINKKHTKDLQALKKCIPNSFKDFIKRNLDILDRKISTVEFMK